MQKKCHGCGVVSDVEDKPFAACPECGLPYGRKPAPAQTAQTIQPRATPHLTPAPPAQAQPRQKVTVGLIVERVAWFWVLVLSIYGMIQFGYSMSTAESAPQQAAGAAMGLAWAAIPYCIARAIQAQRRL